MEKFVPIRAEKAGRTMHIVSQPHCNPKAAGLTSNVAHAGFDNRGVYSNGNPRESVEARCFVDCD